MFIIISIVIAGLSMSYFSSGPLASDDSDSELLSKLLSSAFKA